MKKIIFKTEMLDFMTQIRFNNNKQFMHDNRDLYNALMKDPYHHLISALAETMQSIDPLMEVRPSKVLSRIFRDTRFSNNKDPYRDHHWIAFRHQGEPRDQSLMYWFEIRLDAVHWGLGFWGENKKALDVLRRRIMANPIEAEQMMKIISASGFTISGNSYKRMKHPEKLSKNLKELYLKRELYISKDAKDPAIVFTSKLVPELKADFLALKPIYHMLRGCYETGLIEA